MLANEAKIKAENNVDVELAQTTGISKSLIDRLTIKSGKVRFCCVCAYDVADYCYLLISETGMLFSIITAQRMACSGCDFYIYSLLSLSPIFSQIAALASSLRTLADMKEPVGEVLKRTEVRNN